MKVAGRQPDPRSFHTATTVGNRVVVLGGRGIQNQHFDEVNIFDTGMLYLSDRSVKIPANGKFGIW